MCGRFTLTTDNLATLVEALGIVPSPEQLEIHRPRYNVAPGDVCWIVRERDGTRQLVQGAWGLVNHWETRRTFAKINARAETVRERPAFRKAYASRRCIVLSDGFYEWRGPKNQREPLWFHAPDRTPLYLAGLYETWTSPEAERLRTFTIVTTTPNALVAPVHDRMPVIVPAERVDRWLAGDDSATLLTPAADDVLVARPASPRVGRADNDDPDLLDPDDPRVVRQLALF